MPGTLEEAFAQADAQLNNDGDSQEVEESESREEVSEEVEEVEDTSQDQVEETESNDEESFTKVNPEELPEELKGIYKSLQADYTRKTQEIAKQRKASDSRIQELEDRLKDFESSQKKDDQQNQEQTPEQQLKNFVKGQIEQERVAEYREQALSDYENADPRLVLDSEDYDKATDLYVGQEMDQRLREHLKSGKPEYTFNHTKALKEVLSDWGNYLQSKQQAFLTEQQKKAKAKAKQVQKQNPKGKSAASKPKKPTLDEAIALAQQKA